LIRIKHYWPISVILGTFITTNQTGIYIMLTTSEIAVTVTIWILLIAGCFFGIRGIVRREKQKRIEKQKP